MTDDQAARSAARATTAMHRELALALGETPPDRAGECAHFANVLQLAPYARARFPEYRIHPQMSGGAFADLVRVIPAQRRRSPYLYGGSRARPS